MNEELMKFILELVADDDIVCTALIDMCKAHCNFNLCEQLGVGLFHVFKKSTKHFER